VLKDVEVTPFELLDMIVAPDRLLAAAAFACPKGGSFLDPQVDLTGRSVEVTADNAPLVAEVEQLMEEEFGSHGRDQDTLARLGH
jgi:predicted ester cyclase